MVGGFFPVTVSSKLNWLRTCTLMFSELSLAAIDLSERDDELQSEHGSTTITLLAPALNGYWAAKSMAEKTSLLVSSAKFESRD